MAYHQAFLWGRSQNKLRQEERWLESFCIIGLFLAALILFVVNLGSLPLLDPKEATIAQVAKEILQAPEGTWNWIFPTLWGKPYLNHPPLVHDLIAFTYALGGVNEFTTRLPGAILASISVLLVYGVGREIFVARIPALFSALVYLTLLPVIYQSRLAMLDGPLLCFELLTIWGMLRSRRDLRWTLVTGLGLSALLLTKGLMGLLLAGVVILFLLWDTPRLVTSAYLWIGIGLGIVPALAWYILQWHQYNWLHLELLWQSLVSLRWLPDEVHSWEYYGLSLLKYPLPWIVFTFYGLKLAWAEQNWGWSKLILVWSGVYLIAALAIASAFAWYALAIYPALALVTGIQLERIRHAPSYLVYPRFWTMGFGLMTGLTIGVGLYFVWKNYLDIALVLIFISLTLTLGITTLLLAKGDRQFIALLFWGMYVSLFLLINSSHWIWELNRDEPVKPIAAAIEQTVPDKQLVYTSYQSSRPSLNFYSGHLVVPASNETLKERWQKLSKPFLLVDSLTLDKLNLQDVKILNPPKEDDNSWLLITKTKTSS
ncbi:MAG: ArnT family glycosyltransferase [Xenococcaceae cyanobacterium]